MSKPRVIKDFDKLDQQIQEQIKLAYQEGFEDFLITFQNKDGKRVSALPFEAKEKYYLVRMTVKEAQDIIEDDDDYDLDGFLKDDVKDKYEDKYANQDADINKRADSVADESSQDF